MRERRGHQEEAGRATRGLRRVTVYITEITEERIGVRTCKRKKRGQAPFPVFPVTKTGCRP